MTPPKETTPMEDRCSASRLVNGIHLWASDKFPKVCKKCGAKSRAGKEE